MSDARSDARDRHRRVVARILVWLIGTGVAAFTPLLVQFAPSPSGAEPLPIEVLISHGDIFAVTLAISTAAFTELLLVLLQRRKTTRLIDVLLIMGYVCIAIWTSSGLAKALSGAPASTDPSTTGYLIMSALGTLGGGAFYTAFTIGLATVLGED